MKRCLVCNVMNSVAAASCISCGEASWSYLAAPIAEAPIAEAPKKAARKKKASVDSAPQSAEDAAPAEDISDAEFAAALSSANDVEMLSLLGDENLKPEWRKLVEDEIDKRMS